MFSDALGRAHNGGWGDGLVGGEQDDTGMVNRRVDEILGGDDVIGDGGQRLLFDERNVLECGRMEHELRAVNGEDLVE